MARITTRLVYDKTRRMIVAVSPGDPAEKGDQSETRAGNPLPLLAYELRRYKYALVDAALAACRGNRTHAARALGITRTGLLRMLSDRKKNQEGHSEVILMDGDSS